MNEEEKIFRPDIQARYKIEVTFGKQHTRMMSLGAIQILESGTALHGGGDIKIYWCPGENCGMPMDYSSKSAGEPYCEHCHRIWKGEQLVGERIFRLPIQKVAELVTKTFHQLGSNADIYVKYHPTDLRRATLNFKATDQEVQLGKARAGRQRPYIYTLARIIKDTAAGSSIDRRIKAFLEA